MINLINITKKTYDSPFHFLLEPHHNGTLTFILGIIFVLSVYHTILFFQNKDKSYMYYGLFTFLLFITYSSRTENDIFSYIFRNTKTTIQHYLFILIWLYNTIYFSFGLSFIDLKNQNKKWYSIISKGVYGLFIFGFCIQIISNITGNPEYIHHAYSFIFLPLITIFSLLSFYVILKLNSPLKYYLVIGSAFLFISSMVATAIVDLKLIENVYNAGSLIFFIGLIVENVFFSLGLGYKQKLILIEKTNTQARLIIEYQENQKLKQQLNNELSEKVKMLEEKIISKAENYELKMTAFKSQMNPHFLFNSLNAIKCLIIDNNTRNAVFYLNKFSKLMRSILDNSTKQVYSLKEELEFLDLYVTIENFRFNNEVNYKTYHDEKLNLSEIKIPVLILQPIIENSFWHGLTMKDGVKKLNLSISSKSKSNITISIRDYGIGRKEANRIKKTQLLEKKSMGINLTKERLLNYYDNNVTIQIIDHIDEHQNSLGTETLIEIINH